MIIPFNSNRPIEKYSSYKKRKFEKTKSRLLILMNGINQLSLKERNKVILKNQCRNIIKNL